MAGQAASLKSILCARLALVVFGRDVAVPPGLVFALGAAAAMQVTGNPLRDVLGTISIGVLLIVIAVFIAREVKILLGRQSLGPIRLADMIAFPGARPEIPGLRKRLPSVTWLLLDPHVEN